MLSVVICLAVSLAACTIGAVCGIGGGVIIKPVLDLTGVAGPLATSLLSGGTVLAMSVVSLLQRTRAGQRIIPHTGIPIALGAAVGGLAGSGLFELLCRYTSQSNAGTVQNSVLLVLTAATLLYTFFQGRIQGISLTCAPLVFLSGFLLGCASSLLGIGGGPFNLIVLALLLQMDSGQASFHSLLIIAVSQAVSLISSGLTGGFAGFSLPLLAGMVCCGIAGGHMGSALYRRLTRQQADRLFRILLAVIMGVCVFNILR